MFIQKGVLIYTKNRKLKQNNNKVVQKTEELTKSMFDEATDEEGTGSKHDQYGFIWTSGEQSVHVLSMAGACIALC